MSKTKRWIEEQIGTEDEQYLDNMYWEQYQIDGMLWPGRLISFGGGIIVFTVLTYIIMGESITLKTIISLILACILVSIQVFWK